MESCHVCGVQHNTSPCDKCNVFRSCQTHMKSHLVDDKCSAFKVDQNKESGRYFVATRKIRKGEIILSDQAAVVGPMYTKCRISCLNCLKTTNLQPCSKCSWPVCSQECENGFFHLHECSILSNAQCKPNVSFDQESFHLYPCITPLRLLLLRETDPDAWRVLDTFMDHNDDRENKDNQAWKLHELLVRNFIQKYLKLDFSDNEIKRCIGIIRTNTVKLDSKEDKGDGVAIFPTYSFANHSCICNTYTKKRDNRLELIAVDDINEGDQIWTRYTTPQIGSYQRVMDIQKTWHFVCKCPRCLDPSELGYYSTKA